MLKVLFVCMGNICRSPTAEAVFRQKVQAAGMSAFFEIDSCGTHGYHIGQAPDERSQKVALEAGYDISEHRARRITQKDFVDFDFVLAMDEVNMQDLARLVPREYAHKIHLLLEFAAEAQSKIVPDPYYEGEQAFRDVVRLCETGSVGFLRYVQAQNLM